MLLAGEVSMSNLILWSFFWARINKLLHSAVLILWGGGHNTQNLHLIQCWKPNKKHSHYPYCRKKKQPQSQINKIISVLLYCVNSLLCSGGNNEWYSHVMRECKLNTYWKNQTFTAVCIYIFYIYLYIYIYIAVITVTSQKRFNGLNNLL